MQDVSSMSDAELLAALGQPAAQPQAQTRQAAPAPVRAPTNAPRGIRNNNPGNVEDGAFARSLPGYAGSDGRFARFSTPEAGENVAPALLQSYVRRGFDTPAEIINRWAPPSDNNPTQAYAQYVAQRVGVDVNQQISPDQIPLVAAAIKEFENGSRVSGPQQAPADDFGTMSDEALMAALQEPDAPATQPSTPQMFNGRPVQIEVSDPIQADASGAYDLSNPTAGMDLEALRRGDRVTLADGQTRTLRGTPYADNSRGSDQQVGSFNLREPNATDTAGAYATASTEQIPFADEAATGLSAMLNGRGYSEERQRTLQQRERMNQTDGAARDAGGLTGFALGLAAPGASYIRGATGLSRVGRAAQVGAGYGAAYGAGNTDGDLGDRLAAGGSQAALGAFGGAAFQRGADVLGAVASRARANPSAARQLSAAGVDLTPGQMIGGATRRIEDGLQSVPIMGDGIRDARRRGLETFNSAAINEAIRPVGQVQNTGRAGLGEAGATVSGAYDNALTGVSVPRDGALDASLTAAARINPLPPELQSSFGALLNNWSQRFGQGMAGPEWKQLDSEIGAAVRSAQSGSATNPAQRLLADKLIQTREAFQGALERANPQAFAAVRQADTANAGLTRIRDAGQSLGTAARDGIFTPGDLNRAVRNGDSSAGNRQYAQGSALLQQLSDNAASVLPSTVPDSGTPFRSLLTVGGIGGGAAATTGGAAAIPAMAATAGLFGGGALYGRGVQGIINRAYRASTPGAARQALADLQAAAARSPVLQPVYEALQSSLLPLLRGEPTQGSTPALSGSPR